MTLPVEITSHFLDYTITHKEIEPAGAMQHVAEIDASGQKLLSLFETVVSEAEKREFPNADIWLSKTIERLDTMKKAAASDSVKKIEQIQERANVLLKKRKPAEAQEKTAAKKAKTEILSPLYEACFSGSIDEAALFLEARADVNQRNGDNQETALHVAARNGHKACIELLQKRKADLNAFTKSGETALYIALKAHQVEAATALIAFGAHTSLRNGPNSETALHAAVVEQLCTMIKPLIDSKSDRNAQTKVNQSPLYLALLLGEVDIARQLLSAGVHVNQRNGTNYETALHVAARLGQEEIVQWLVEHGAERDPVTGSGETPLYMAFSANHYGVVQILLQAKANPNAKNGPDGKAILHLAAENDLVAWIQVLADLKADLNIQTNARKSAIELAAQGGKQAAVDRLLSLGIKAEEKKVVRAPSPPPFFGSGIQNPQINACFMNATVQALRSCAPFCSFLEAHRATLKPAGKEDLRSLLSLSASQRCALWKEVAIALRLYPRTKEESLFPPETPIEHREAYLTITLATLSLAPEQVQSLVSLLTCKSEDRLAALSDLVYESLLEIFDKLQKKGDALDADTMQTLRHMVSVAGFPVQKPTSQEDAQEFLLYLLEILKAPSFHTRTSIEHELDFPVPSLDLQKDKRRCLILPVSDAPKGTTLEQLVTSNIIQEEIDKKAILQSSSLKATDQEMDSILKLPDIKQAKTLQSISLKREDLPQFLPVSLVRYVRKENATQKVTTEFPLSSTLEIPITDEANQCALYCIASVVVHDGASPHSGHYRSYALQEVNGKYEWVEYNDSKITLRKDTEAVLRDIAHNGYLFFYKHVTK